MRGVFNADGAPAPACCSPPGPSRACRSKRPAGTAHCRSSCSGRPGGSSPRPSRTGRSGTCRHSKCRGWSRPRTILSAHGRCERMRVVTRARAIARQETRTERAVTAGPAGVALALKVVAVTMAGAVIQADGVNADEPGAAHSHVCSQVMLWLSRGCAGSHRGQAAGQARGMACAAGGLTFGQRHSVAGHHGHRCQQQRRQDRGGHGQEREVNNSRWPRGQRCSVQRSASCARCDWLASKL